VDKLDEETNEAHDSEADRRRNGDLLEFFSVGLCAPLDQSHGVLGKLFEGLDELHDLVHVCGVVCASLREVFGQQSRSLRSF